MLTAKIRRALTVAFASKDAGKVVADAIDAATTPVPHIAAIGATTNLRTDTVANLGADAEARLDALEGKFDALITALTQSGKMSAS